MSKEGLSEGTIEALRAIILALAEAEDSLNNEGDAADNGPVTNPDMMDSGSEKQM